MSITLSTKTAVGLIVAGLVVLVLAANAHLVYVAVTSQPDCVAHLKQADAGKSGSFRAAKSACSPGARS
jgi:hypothetical protein